MALNLASLNVRGLRDSSKCTRLLAELKNLEWMLLQCRRLTSLAVPTVGCWKAILTFLSIRQPHQRWGLFASWTQPWCWCWRCFCRWRGPVGCGRCCREKFQVSSGCGLCVQYRCGEGFLFSSVGAVPGRYEAASLNGWLECDPWSKIDKVGRGANRLEGVKAALSASWLVTVSSTGFVWITQGGRCGRG